MFGFYRATYTPKCHPRHQAARQNSLRPLGAQILCGALFCAIVTLSLTSLAQQSHAQQQSPKDSKAANATSTSSSASIENGKRLYTNDGCYECHGRAGQGALSSGPRIGPDPAVLVFFIAYIRHPAGQMPPYTEKVISDAELNDIHQYLMSLPPAPAPRGIPILNSGK
jgi:mono/diheme cytochrome c family protein